jgi:zinc/manganese transport system permease protein
VSVITALPAGDPITGIAHMFALPFEVRAYLAGTLIAAAAGLAGYFVVLRAQVFTGDALSHVAFTGALAALAAGIDLRVGLFAACVTFAVAMAVLGRAARADDVVIGNVFAWILGLGVFFLTVYTTGASATGGGNNGGSGVNVLFGSIFGLTAGQATLAAVIAAVVIAAILAIARPLLFASIDPAVAAARGVPVRLLGIGFLVLVGITAGEATQAVGALLILGLLATPAATAQRLTTRPFTAMWASAGIAVASIWAGLGIAYAASSIPPSFAIVAVAVAAYVITLAATSLTRRRTPGAQAAPATGPASSAP